MKLIFVLISLIGISYVSIKLWQAWKQWQKLKLREEMLGDAIHFKDKVEQALKDALPGFDMDVKEPKAEDKTLSVLLSKSYVDEAQFFAVIEMKIEKAREHNYFWITFNAGTHPKDYKTSRSGDMAPYVWSGLTDFDIDKMHCDLYCQRVHQKLRKEVQEYFNRTQQHLDSDEKSLEKSLLLGEEV
jgi:hypothetical protein